MTDRGKKSLGTLLRTFSLEVPKQGKIKSRDSDPSHFFPVDLDHYDKICIIKEYLLKYFFECHLIYKCRYHRQTNLT